MCVCVCDGFDRARRQREGSCLQYLVRQRAGLPPHSLNPRRSVGFDRRVGGGKGRVDKERGGVDKERGGVDKERGGVDKERGGVDKEGGGVDKEEGVCLNGVGERQEVEDDDEEPPRAATQPRRDSVKKDRLLLPRR